MTARILRYAIGQVQIYDSLGFVPLLQKYPDHASSGIPPPPPGGLCGIDNIRPAYAIDCDQIHTRSLVPSVANAGPAITAYIHCMHPLHEECSGHVWGITAPSSA